ncbi:ABC transporter substrate-binding protein [Agromyces sp. H3Y2-19a]|jgi:NitT/TauT family transport system substrate-binding protein|uniref:ABC transporter substrate-binding protein n=1 Tax=Agromyces chromiiresistens TaxID=3030835 RepID=UPI0023B9CAF7|nr:ABC transporter substrate-binding protein [Agromyces chromiiresistens]MDF0512063.1 ABC transporter substrate-binding protein [Agromyces chromiiresistens]
MRTSIPRSGRAAIAALAALALLAGCAAAGPGASSDPVELADGEPGAAEDTEITVAIPFPDITMYSMYVLANDLGYYEEEGLDVEVITADNVTAAVASGSADIGVESTGTVIEAIRGGVGVDLVGGHYCRQNFDFAAQQGVTKVDDLDGTSIVLAGTPGDPAEFQRKRVLKEEGWDLDTVQTEVVYPGPGSESWTEFFVNDKISMQPFYADDRPALEEHGANIIVESLRNWANDVQVAGTGWAAENPNSLVRFLRATIKATDYMTAPAPGEFPENVDSVLDIYEANDFDVADLRDSESPWVLDGHLACPNLSFDTEAWDTTIETQNLQPLEFDESQLVYLLKAQELLGLTNEGPADLVYPGDASK